MASKQLPIYQKALWELAKQLGREDRCPPHTDGVSVECKASCVRCWHKWALKEARDGK